MISAAHGKRRNGLLLGLQVNLDFEDEADMVEKMRIGMALQPVATALFANSPFRDGKDTGVAPTSHIPACMAAVAVLEEPSYCFCFLQQLGCTEINCKWRSDCQHTLLSAKLLRRMGRLCQLAESRVDRRGPRQDGHSALCLGRRLWL